MSLRDVAPVKPQLNLSSEGSKSPQTIPSPFIAATVPPPCMPSTSKPIKITKPLPAILKKAEQKQPEQQTKLPIDCRKQLFVSIPPVRPSTSAASSSTSTSNNNISIQPSTSKKRNSKVFEATSFAKLGFENDPSSPQVR